VLYTWILVLLCIKERLNETNKREFTALLFATLNTIFGFSKHEQFSIYMQIILAIISNAPGSLNFTKNVPLVGSLFLNSEFNKNKFEDGRIIFIL